jgi:hypothetical protein
MLDFAIDPSVHYIGLLARTHCHPETERLFGLSRSIHLQPVRFAYQPPASSTFLSQQTSHQQPASNTFLSEQNSTSHQPNEHAAYFFSHNTVQSTS